MTFHDLTFQQSSRLSLFGTAISSNLSSVDDDYLSVLKTSKEILPDIQRISVKKMTSEDYETLWIYNHICSTFGDILSSLSVWILGIQQPLGAVEILENFTRQIPIIRHLKVKIGKIYLVNKVIYIELPHFLKINKKLETLEIIYYRTAVPNSIMFKSSYTLKHLKLTASRVDLHCINYIMHALPVLDKLVFNCH